MTFEGLSLLLSPLTKICFSFFSFMSQNLTKSPLKMSIWAIKHYRQIKA